MTTARTQICEGSMLEIAYETFAREAARNQRLHYANRIEFKGLGDLQKEDKNSFLKETALCHINHTIEWHKPRKECKACYPDHYRP